MKIVSYISDIRDFESLDKSQCREVVIATKLFSQVGKLSVEQMQAIIEECRRQQINYSLEWDILMTETRFKIYKEQFLKYANLGFSSIRLRDPGAINFCLETFTDLKIDLLLDSGGHHNVHSIRVWRELIGERLRKVVLSIELSSDVVKEFCDEIKSWGVLTELLVLGRILLFYTPRNLVSPLYSDEVLEDDYIEVAGSSEESPHKGFPIIENQHGTFMFNTKDQYLLEYLDELVACGLDDIRIDLRHFEYSVRSGLFAKAQELSVKFDKSVAKDIKADYPNSTTRGFFHVNKSDVLFKKLKNKRTQRQDEGFIGEVVDVVKKSHIAILVKGMRDRQYAFKVGDELKLSTPDGKVKTSKIHKIMQTDGIEVNSVTSGELILIPHVSGISVKTMAYLSL